MEGERRWWKAVDAAHLVASVTRARLWVVVAAAAILQPRCEASIGASVPRPLPQVQADVCCLLTVKQTDRGYARE